MAFPTIQTADTTNGTVASNSASWTLTYPANISAGQLLVGFMAADGAITTTWPAGWVKHDVNSGANTLTFAKKSAVGSETGTFSVTLSGGEQGGWRIFRVTGWEGTLGTVIRAVDGDPGAVEVVHVSGSSSTPNPPNLDPTNWATEDTLWFAACSLDTSRTISVYPLAGNNTADVSGGSGGATLGICTTTSAVSALDPGTFTISASDDWVAATYAVRPSGAAPATTGSGWWGAGMGGW